MVLEKVERSVERDVSDFTRSGVRLELLDRGGFSNGCARGSATAGTRRFNSANQFTTTFN